MLHVWQVQALGSTVCGHAVKLVDIKKIVMLLYSLVATMGELNTETQALQTTLATLS